jgi:hypothetical protein
VVPPEEFVATRNALVKELRKAGDRDQAAEVAALRRPSVPDWALNVVAHDHPDELAPFLAAAERSRLAQRDAASGRAGTDLRGAIQELRAATDAVVRAAVAVAKAVGKPVGPLPAQLAGRLQEVAASAGLADQARRGRLGSGDPEPDELFEGVRAPTSQAQGNAAGKAKPRAKGVSTTATEGADEAREPGALAVDPKVLRRLEKELDAARQRQEDASSAEREAAAGLAEAEEARTGMERAREEAERALAAAEEALDRAVRQVDEARDAHERARRALAKAEDQLAEASEALADAEAG